jgi:hypothetical protein
VTLSRVSLPVLIVLSAALAVAASAATPGPKPPRIVSAAMQDSDRDARADSVRVTYSARVRHVRDRDGRYPFTVAGYRIRSIGVASGRALVITLAEHGKPDPQARPALRYRRTRVQPVTGMTGRQAAGQLVRLPRPHGRTLPAAPPPPPVPGDSDGDRTIDTEDCAPKDASIHPGAPDLPDLAFVDSNCDGIDGTEKDAIFASPKGSDADPGTRAKPKRQVQAALDAAQTGKKHQVLAAAGSYAHVTAVSGVGVYGGYDSQRWSRAAGMTTVIGGSTHGLVAVGATDVTLQLLTIRAINDGASVYGIRGVNGSKLRLERVSVTAGAAAGGAGGSNGAPGASGSAGKPGQNGACDSFVRAIGGAGGESPVGRDGGEGGNAYYEIDGEDGAPGLVGTPGGEGGDGGQPAESAHPGKHGANGAPGSASRGGTDSIAHAAATWEGAGGIDGIYGAPGNGGGGGGGGGGQDGYFVTNGSGNAGSGGGGGGAGGRGGQGGGAGGGSFGIYLYKSSIVAEKSSVTAGDGGPGGRGGNGGPGGAGGKGGPWILYCGDEIGHGGAGGKGGDGGRGGGGGGGAGGPSIGVMKVGSSSAVLTATAVVVGDAGPGGANGAGGSEAAPSQKGIVQAIYP